MIGFNPCGHAVEWLRFPYTRKARLFNSPDAPLVDLVWYPTDLPFLPFPTTINAKVYDDDAANHHGLGEVWYPSVPKPNFIKKIPGLTGDHICGTPEQFMYGQGRPADPPTLYDRDNIPLCCGRFPTGQVSAGVRPAALVEYHAGYSTRVTSAVRPAAVVTSSTTATARTAAGVRPDAVVTFTPAEVRSIGVGVRPGAVVTFTPVDRAEVSAGVRPDAVVSYTPADLPRVGAGVWPMALVASSSECQRESTTCGGAFSGPLRLFCFVRTPGPIARWWRWDWGGAPGWQFRTGIGTLEAYTCEWKLYTGNSCLDLTVFASGTSLPQNTSWDIPTGFGDRVYLSIEFVGVPLPTPVTTIGVFSS